MNPNPLDFRQEPPYRHGNAPSIGVLLANLGTPDEPTPKALRRYLREFLNDRRVIELPRWKWWPILYGPVLTFRPKKVAKLYASIWSDAGSPLFATAKKQRDALALRFRDAGRQPVRFALGMRYGNPSIRSALAELRQQGAERILVLPLYPHYAAATTASTLDALAKEITQWRRVPELRTINSYHDHPGWVAALAASIRETWSKDGAPEKILFSYHGIPKRYFEGGDPYHCFCHKSTRLVREILAPEFGIGEDAFVTTFQSLFGREEWIKPATDATVKALATAGTERLDVVCPGFSADCLETLEEINVENRAIFEHIRSGPGRSFRYIPCLNDRIDHIDALESLISEHLQGWWSEAPAWQQRLMELEKQPAWAENTAVTAR